MMKDLTNNRFSLILLLVITLGALVLLGSGVSGLQFQAGRELNLLDWFFARLESLGPPADLGLSERPPNPFFSQETGEGIIRLMILSFWLMLIFSIVYAIISPDFRKELIRGLVLILLVIWLLPLIANNLNQKPEGLEGAEAPPGDYFFGEATLPDPPPFIQDPPGWIFILVNGLLLLVAAVGIYAVWRRLRPRSDAQAVVVKEIRRALGDLDKGRELKNVVITCYAQMCARLEKRPRVQRQSFMTPREFNAHLARAGVASDHIHQLTDLFERVRYGAKPTDPVSEADARACLEAILEVYGD